MDKKCLGCFDSIEVLLKEFWTDGMNLPSNDDEIVRGFFAINSTFIKVNKFEDIVTELSIIYWNNIKIK